MKCGISTACLYPQNTLDCMRTTAALSPSCAEVFLNTFSELDQPYVDSLRQIQKEHNLQVVSVHPFSSEMESFFFFTDYEPRFEDGLRLYRRYFEVCNQLGAKILVFHGNRSGRVEVPMEKYAQRFCRLCAEGEKYGILVAHENVGRCQCGHPEEILRLRRLADRPIHFVLDLKQSLRADVDPLDMVDAMGAQNICHLHLSDADLHSDCKLPGKGQFRFEQLFRKLYAGGFAGNAVIELYRAGFDTPQQLLEASGSIQRLANSIKEEIL